MSAKELFLSGQPLLIKENVARIRGAAVAKMKKPAGIKRAGFRSWRFRSI
jgi:hypothetical protein